MSKANAIAVHVIDDNYFDRSAFLYVVGVPNKPMVLTALTTTEERSPDSGRQHIGEPLDRRATGRR